MDGSTETGQICERGTCRRIYGGHAHVGYTKLDAFNQYSRQEAERIAEGDAATTLAYLKSKTMQDPNFFMEYTLNEENMLENVFLGRQHEHRGFRVLRRNIGI
ncbi:hypothetical protein LINPERPRIM_LOCUS31284 [Linum perenne]